MKKALFQIPILVSCFLLHFHRADAQNIGIGTSTPSELLEVAGGDARINQLTIGKGGGNILTNVVIGDSALYNNTIGSNNTAIGTKALFKNITGAVNVAIGRLTLQ
ncbi:MAG: hypothetical protein IPP72_12360 [Chitinophagaceae bacterium]|nr:hypothetical protein [Chitinophagaceae bacterium]